MQFYEVTRIEPRTPLMSDRQGPRLYHNILSKLFFNWSMIANDSFYLRNV